MDKNGESILRSMKRGGKVVTTNPKLKSFFYDFLFFGSFTDKNYQVSLKRLFFN